MAVGFRAAEYHRRNQAFQFIHDLDALTGDAVAIVSPKTTGGYLVSVRVPRDSTVSAEAFCRTFPTGGGRRTAAGINDLPSEDLHKFTEAFEAQFGAG